MDIIMKKLLKEYYNIYNEFYTINKYREMKSITHHGNNRLAHVNRVAKMSFYISKKLNLDYISCTRGAMLHDFFVKEDINKKKYGKFLKNHPLIALENSKKYFDINELEEDIIKTHMYPVTNIKPNYKESNIVCICDKIISIYEFLRYEIKLTTDIFIIFLFNIMSS